MDTNPEQRHAIEAGNGPIAIIAGPGTGKTKTLVARLHFLIDQGVPPARLLALTFTKKAAQEMTARFGAGPGNQPHISTFHALCFELLSEKLGRPPEFITEPARLALLKQLPRPTDLKGLTARELGLRISRAKNGAEQSAPLNAVMTQYNRALAEQGLSDFDDLLLQTRNLLQTDPAWRASVQTKFEHILVDEFQDTNALQYELLNLLRANDNLFVIGDPAQSIYGFRGAAGDIFSIFARDFPEARTIVFTINYRSAKAVVRLANTVYPDAPALTAYATQQGVVQATEVLNEHSEANYVLTAIQQAIGGSDFHHAVSDDHRSSHLALGNIAILYRSRIVARVLQKQLEASGIPFQVVGEGSPYETPAVQTILQLFGQAADPTRQAVVEGLSHTQITTLIKTIKPAQPPHESAATLAEQFGFALTPTLRQFLSSLVRFKTIAEAVAYFDSIADTGFYDPRADAVTLLTIHAAKGLEFEKIFLLAAEDGVLPSRKGELAEEKRLFYVAVTRAKQQLQITYARFRGGQAAKVSPFITAIAERVLPRQQDPALKTDERRLKKRQAKRAQTHLFSRLYT